MCLESLRPRPAHLAGSFWKPCRGCIEVPPHPAMPSPGLKGCLVAGEVAPGLRVLPQETVCPDAPAAVVPSARSSAEVRSQVQGG